MEKIVATPNNVKVGTKVIIDKTNTRLSKWATIIVNSDQYRLVEYFKVIRFNKVNDNIVYVNGYNLNDKKIDIAEDVLCIGYDGFYDVTLYENTPDYDLDSILNNLDKLRYKLPKKKWWKIF